LLAVCDVPFEDVRVTKEQWEKMKKDVPTQQLPMLEWTDNGKVVRMNQTLAICRAIARWKSYGGQTLCQKNQADEVVETVRDMMEGINHIKYESDAARKAEMIKKFIAETGPRCRDFLEAKLTANGGQYFAGVRTYADTVFAAAMDNIMHDNPFGLPPADFEKKKAELSAKYPKLCGLHKHVTQKPQIAAWLAKRPVTAN